MAFPDSTGTCVGALNRIPISKEKETFMWDIFRYIDENREGNLRELRSDDFSFAGATWNFFASFDPSKTRSQFGINAQKHSSSEGFDCNCDFVFTGNGYGKNGLLKAFECQLKCESAGSHWAVTDFLTSPEMKAFFDDAEIYCIISVKNIKERHTQAQLPENKDEDIPRSHPVYKVCQDLKQLLLCEEDSDVTFQVGDQQFKAHRSILKARSSVFAARLGLNTKEKAMGVVNAEDCEPSSFPVLLEFLYCGSTEKLSVENVFSLYTSADKYDVQDLKIKCLEFIKNNLSVETFCETVKLGLKHSETNLLNLTTEFFAGNFKKILLTVKWQAFNAENTIIVNEILIKALASDVQND